MPKIFGAPMWLRSIAERRITNGQAGAKSSSLGASDGGLAEESSSLKSRWRKRRRSARTPDGRLPHPGTGGLQIGKRSTARSVPTPRQRVVANCVLGAARCDLFAGEEFSHAHVARSIFVEVQGAACAPARFSSCPAALVPMRAGFLHRRPFTHVPRRLRQC